MRRQKLCSRWRVHAIFDCCDCDWSSQSQSGQDAAARHHRKTGHRVNGEVGYAVHFPATGKEGEAK